MTWGACAGRLPHARVVSQLMGKEAARAFPVKRNNRGRAAHFTPSLRLPPISDPPPPFPPSSLASLPWPIAASCRSPPLASSLSHASRAHRAFHMCHYLADGISFMGYFCEKQYETLKITEIFTLQGIKKHVERMSSEHNDSGNFFKCIDKSKTARA